MSLDPNQSRETTEAFMAAADAAGDVGLALDLFLRDRGVSEEDRGGVAAWLAGTARETGPMVAVAPEPGARALLVGGFLLGWQSAEQTVLR